MPREKSKEDPSWSLHPELHDSVAEKLEEVQLEYTLNPNDEEHSCIKATIPLLWAGLHATTETAAKKSGQATLSPSPFANTRETDIMRECTTSAAGDAKKKKGNTET